MINRIKDFLYQMVLRLAQIGFKKKGEKRALIVKTDEIGDYILWRKFISPILESEILKGYSVDLIGNASWKKIAVFYDASKFNHVIWLDKNSFKKNLWYRYLILRSIYKQGYDIVINPIYSRDPRYDEAIVIAANAGLRIGMNRNEENYRSYERKKYLKLYNKVFDFKEYPVFEFYRNKAFAAFIAERKVDVKDNLMEEPKQEIISSLPHEYFVVFPGSRSVNRIWDTKNFIECANYLFKKTKLTALVCGSNADKFYTSKFVAEFQNPLIDLSGKTDLLQMLSILKNAFCLISVDTGSVHLAAAMGCTVFGVFNGSQYGRFSPYPPEVAKNIFAIYPDEVEMEIKNANGIPEKYLFTVNIPYNSVPANKVIEVMKKYLDKEDK